LADISLLVLLLGRVRARGEGHGREGENRGGEESARHAIHLAVKGFPQGCCASYAAGHSWRRFSNGGIVAAMT
jgi:hypothetical protein